MCSLSCLCRFTLLHLLDILQRLLLLPFVPLKSTLIPLAPLQLQLVLFLLVV